MKTLEPTEIYLLTLNVVIVIIYSIFSPGFVFWQDDWKSGLGKLQTNLPDKPLDMQTKRKPARQKNT